MHERNADTSTTQHGHSDQPDDHAVNQSAQNPSPERRADAPASGASAEDRIPPDAAPLSGQSDDGPSLHQLLRESVQVVIPAILLATVVHLFLAQATVVYGQSMEPNLSQHQRLIIDKISYRLHAPQRGDIVVLDLPQMDEMLVKRVVGLPGETVAVQDGIVYVNGQPLPEPFPHDMTSFSMQPIVLGPLNYFVMGDNRGNSNDSRSFGPVSREYILGRVWLRYWPLDELTLF